MKYKSGDKVVITNNKYFSAEMQHLKIGTICTITEPAKFQEDNTPFKWNIKESDHWIAENEFEMSTKLHKALL